MTNRAKTTRVCVFGIALVAACVLSASSAESCPRNCPATQKDAKGCCPAKAAPAPKGTREGVAPALAKPPPNVKPPRRAKTPDVRCPKGSVFRAGRCVGLVECPDGFAFERGKCRPNNPPKPTTRARKTREGMVYVEEGYFIRGSNDEQADEKPAGRVWLDGYWIDKYEVTVGEYAACVKAGKCTVPKKKGWTSDNWGSSGPRPERMKHPINGVDWYQAQAYCAWKGKRLPTEAEWEKAVRGVDGRKYPWGSAKASCKYAVMNDGGDGCGEERTWEVGSKPEGVSPYGAHDMAGNVWEWTADWYDENYYASNDGKGRNPMGPRSGYLRVMRGGSWAIDGGYMRASNRAHYAPSGAVDGLGFRCSGSTE